jgi:hypothetical protein
MLQLYTTHHSNSYVFIYHRAFSNPDAELVAAGIDALHVAILDNLASRIHRCQGCVLSTREMNTPQLP